MSSARATSLQPLDRLLKVAQFVLYGVDRLVQLLELALKVPTKPGVFVPLFDLTPGARKPQRQGNEPGAADKDAPAPVLRFPGEAVDLERKQHAAN
jgi:hypothetical protein